MQEQDLALRLSALEKQLRLWKALTLTVVLGLITLGAGAFTQPQAPLQDQGSGLMQVPSSRVLSNSFVLVGKDGKVYAKMTARDGGAMLDFYDDHGRVVWSAPPKLETRPLANP